VGDQRAQVDDAVLEQPARRIPGAEDLTSVEGRHGQILEDQRLRDVDFDGVGRNPEEHHVPSVPDDPERVADCGRRAGHLEDDIQVLALVALDEPGRHVRHVVDVDGIRDAHRVREAEPVHDPVRSQNAPGAEGPHDRDREQADRAAAEDPDRLPGENLRARGEDGIAERLLKGRDLRRELVTVVPPDDGLGHGHVLREGTVTVDAEDLRVLAHVRLPRPAVEAHAASDVALGGDVVARPDVAHVAADLDDRPGELVAERHRRRDPPRRPLVPVEDVEVGAAQARRLDADEDVVVSDRGNGRLHELEARLPAELPHRPHRLVRLLRHRSKVCPTERWRHPRQHGSGYGFSEVRT
jgi:hypothetical protein